MDLQVIRDLLPVEDQLDQLAEEAAELAHAALKLSRKIKMRNPTPVTKREAYERLLEEYSDVTLCAQVIGIEADESMMNAKLWRWGVRLKDE